MLQCEQGAVFVALIYTQDVDVGSLLNPVHQHPQMRTQQLAVRDSKIFDEGPVSPGLCHESLSPIRDEADESP